MNLFDLIKKVICWFKLLFNFKTIIKKSNILPKQEDKHSQIIVQNTDTSTIITHDNIVSHG